MISDRGSLVRLRLISEGLGDLYEMLSEVPSLRLAGRFVVRELHAVGGQSLLWLADDLIEPNQPVLVRMALLQYHRPAYLRDAEIACARKRIEDEAKILSQMGDTCLPRFHGLFYAHNPLQPPERGAEITETEPYLVMELINGVTLAESARRFETAVPFQKTRVLASLALDSAHSVSHLCKLLLEHGYIYTDVNPRNLIHVATPSTWPVRAVDAGSIIPSVSAPETLVPFTWAYIPPDYYHIYSNGGKRWPGVPFVMYTLGKTLWQILTNRQPLPGEHPDLEDATLSVYPEVLIDLIRDLIEGRYRTFVQLYSTVLALQQQLKAFVEAI